MSSNTSKSGSIRNRLLYGTVALVTLPLLALALVLAAAAVRQSGQSLEARANDQLASIRVGKAEELRAYFASVADDLAILARTEQIGRALPELSAALPQLPTQLPLAIDAARSEVGGYYRAQFGAEYARRNGGEAAAIDALLAAQGDATVAAQYLYISSNPNPLGEKGKLDTAGDASTYTAAHARMHPFGRAIVERYGLYDIFLVDPEGNVVYTFFKELDFASNLKTGPFAQSGLAKAWANAAAGLQPGEVRLTDYEPYVPSYEDQAAFVSTPIHVGGAQIGVLIVQLPIDRVNAITTYAGNWKEVGLGDSGEVYLVGHDQTPRSVSRFLRQDLSGFLAAMQALGLPAERIERMRTRASNIGLMTVETEGTRKAFDGQAGVGVYPDYRGIPVRGAYAPLQILNQQWAILAEIDQSEADAPIAALRWQITLVAAVALLVTLLVAVYIALRLSASINRPLAHFGRIVRNVAEGDNAARVRLPASDEIGELGVAFDQMLDERLAVQQRIEHENEQLNNSVMEIMTSVAELAGRNLQVKVPVAVDVTGAVSDAINMMTSSTASALGKVRQISDTVSTASQNVRDRSEQVRNAASEASSQASAASAELQQTAASLREMGEQARTANTNAESAIRATVDAMEIVRSTVGGISESRDQIRETEKRVKRLGERSQEITAVVNIIGQIAERTSVLALNASMQAVAAGDAGRGFAVVADEVKRLAENARAATQQISSLVTAIQADTAETIQAMNSTISQVVDISKLADQAGRQMLDTRSATEQLASAVRQIAQTTQVQSEASKTLLTRARQLLNSSQRTMEELQAQRKDTEMLAHSARELVGTVSEFRLPA